MNYEAYLEKCTRFGEGLLLQNGLFLTRGKVPSYYRSIYLGEYNVKKIADSLEDFLFNIKLIEKARHEDMGLASSLGTFIIHCQTFEDIIKSLAKKYFD
ncbi:MAG: hypothetical protein QW423_02650 [Candidatus Aenigmatarchaeota archaeon]